MKKVKEFSEQALNWGGKHVTFIKGLAALFFGVLLVYVSRQLFANLIVFICGLVLIYYALTELKLRKITEAVDKVIAKFRR